MRDYKGMCLTCKHWNGDRKAQREDIRRNPRCMSLDHGWPKSGQCRIEHIWSMLDVSGDARVTLEIDANFGCNRWEGE